LLYSSLCLYLLPEYAHQAYKQFAKNLSSDKRHYCSSRYIFHAIFGIYFPISPHFLGSKPHIDLRHALQAACRRPVNDLMHVDAYKLNCC
jgi:hypothetical protein